MKKRQIKFKFWLGHTKKMTFLHDISEVSKIIPEFNDDIIPLEFTGRTDKNGVEVCDGDLLKAPGDYFTTDGTHEVFWFGDGWVAASVLFSNPQTANKRSVGYLIDLGAFVIGNIYENPNP